MMYVLKESLVLRKIKTYLIEIAKNMLSLGIDEKIIKKITELFLKQIEDFLSKKTKI